MTTNSDTGNIPIKKCECGICDETFRDDTIVDMAESIATHWNNEHGDDLKGSMKAFDKVQYGGDHITDDVYQIRIQKYYVTVYDILNTDDDRRPFKYEYVKNTKAMDVCKQCHTSINAVESYTELEDNNSYGSNYICNDCEKENEYKKRAEENESLSSFAH